MYREKFLNKLNQQIPQLQAQLPTETQWEYSCRSGTTTPFSFGETITTEQVNFDGNYDGAEGLGRGKTVEVKALPENQWGLYQMHGNVYEWCLDAWNTDLGSSSVTNPVQTSVNTKSVNRVLRGGSWFYRGRNCRSAYRNRITAGNRRNHIGFRLSLGHELQPSAVSRSEKTEIYEPTQLS